MRKATRERQELIKSKSTIEIYEMVLDGSLKTFPRNFWIGADIDSKAAVILNYLFYDIYQYDLNDIKKISSCVFFQENKLTGLLKIYDNSPFKLLSAVYKDKIKPWELSSCPNNYWCDDTCIKATKWLVEEMLNWPIQHAIKNLTIVHFKKYGLDAMLSTVCNGSTYEALLKAYPNKNIKLWDMKNAPNKSWLDDSNVLNCLKWFFNYKMQSAGEIEIEKIPNKTLRAAGLGGLLTERFSGNKKKIKRFLESSDYYNTEKFL